LKGDFTCVTFVYCEVTPTKERQTNGSQGAEVMAAARFPVGKTVDIATVLVHSA